MGKYNKITVVHIGDFLGYPPVISLIENLLHHHVKVDLISATEENRVPEIMQNNSDFNYIRIPYDLGSGVKSKFVRVFSNRKIIRAAVTTSMKTSDILWTTTDVAIKVLGKQLFEYKHVMQLMELIQRFPHFTNIKALDFPIDEYARKAYRVVVPNLDRAFIQQVWWNLKEVPTVLPNKPYSINRGELSQSTQEALEKIKSETRKIILYSGIITPERNIEEFATAIRSREDYVLYVIGRSASGETYLNKLLDENPNIVYLGYHIAPSHLEFIQYAHIGLAPYVPTQSKLHPEINALYCAPNKIYEYSAFGVPMVGTNVLGLLRPFEQYGIGKCAKDMTSKSILECVEYIDEHHDEMRNNCLKFFEKDNLDKIVQDIIEG